MVLMIVHSLNLIYIPFIAQMLPNLQPYMDQGGVSVIEDRRMLFLLVLLSPHVSCCRAGLPW